MLISVHKNKALIFRNDFWPQISWILNPELLYYMIMLTDAQIVPFLDAHAGWGQQHNVSFDVFCNIQSS